MLSSGVGKTLLQRRAEQRKERRIALFDSERANLRQALAEVLPGQTVIVFGSITGRGSFNPASDLDIAIPEEPSHLSIFGLQAFIEERMNRRVDVVLLTRCRFRDKVLREGEAWTT